MVSSTAILFSVVIAVLCVWWFVRRRSRYYMLGNKIPGPRGYPIFGSALDLATNVNRIVQFLFQYCGQYDGIFKFWILDQLCVLISSPEHVQTFFSSASNSLEKPDHYLAMSELTGKKTFLISNGEDWKKSRKIFVTTMNQNPSHQATTFAYATNKLVADLRKKANGETFACATDLRQVALSVAWGNIFGELGRGEQIGAEMVERLVQIEHATMARIYLPPLRNSFLYKLLPMSRDYFKNVEFIQYHMRNALIEKIAEFEDLKKNNQALPNNFFFNRMNNYPVENMQEMVDEYIMLLQTAVATTPVALGYMLLSLALFPEHQEKILDEYNDIKNILGREPENNDLHMYQYLDRAVKESLRILPTIGVVGRVLPNDVQFGKYTVPKDTLLVFSNTGLSHNPEVYPDSFKFDPDRFLPENVEKRHPYAFFPFLAGPRACPGKNYAMSLMKLLIPIILKEFKVVTHYKSMQEVWDNARFHIVTTDAQCFPIKLIPRN